MKSDEFAEISLVDLKLSVALGDNVVNSFNLAGAIDLDIVYGNVGERTMGVGASDKSFEGISSAWAISDVPLLTHLVPLHSNPGQHIAAALSQFAPHEREKVL